MDKSQVRAIVAAEVEPLARQLGIGFWKLILTYEPKRVKNGRVERGHCDRLADYLSAVLNLNPEAFEDEDQVLTTLRHELFHVVLAPYDLFWKVASSLFENDPVKAEMMQSVWMHASEQAVINLERMYHGLTTSDSDAAGATTRHPRG